jgi:hypothetical protein
MVWPDPISLGADIFTLLGVPTLTWSTWRLWRDFKKEKREETQRRAEEAQRKFEAEFGLRRYQESVQFYDTYERAGINVVPFEKAWPLPRPGDSVYLPGETHNGQREYEVEKVSFIFEEAPEIDQPRPAILSKIQVQVHRKERK